MITDAADQRIWRFDISTAVLNYDVEVEDNDIPFCREINADCNVLKMTFFSL